ncbi:MAG: HNH endonuclease [Chloroflexi bacterium]|nr:HNH endonuclease [Chloroflexota bacterium]
MSASVLLLNQNYEPLNVCSVRRAVVLLGRGKAELLENGRGEILTPSRAIPIPSVIRLMYMIKRPLLQRKLSRKEVFLRDSYTCLYCGKVTKELTLDHVVPRYRGGSHSWENVVSAGISCNHRKAGHTPQEAGMRLLKESRPPRVNPYSMFLHKSLQEEWSKFIPWLNR